MTHITEIIPDDYPEWAKKAMDEGQFFNVVCERFKKHEEILKVVNEQAEDDGLWFDPVTITEDYLMRALRRLHRVIEDNADTGGE